MVWELYKEIKYTADGVPPGMLSGFPKLVSVSGDVDIASECSAGGGIKFTTPDGLTDLSFGLYPSVDLSSGDVLARVKLDLSHTASVGDVMCRLYYSATETTTEDKAGTVSNSYVVFCPLEEDPSGSVPQVFDWVSESNIGTTNGSMTTGDLVTGQVGDSLDFDGSNDYISLGGHGVGEDKTATYEAIVKTTQTGGDRWLISEGSIGFGQPVSGFCNENGNLRSLFRHSGGVNLVGTTTINDGLFHGLSMTLDSTVMRLYVDGVEDGSASIASVSISPGVFDRFTIGALGRNTTSSYSQATIDEVRVSTVARSADWLAYAHIDDFDNSSTFILGEEQGGGGGPIFNPVWAVGSNIVIMGM